MSDVFAFGTVAPRCSLSGEDQRGKVWLHRKEQVIMLRTPKEDPTVSSPPYPSPSPYSHTHPRQPSVLVQQRDRQAVYLGLHSPPQALALGPRGSLRPGHGRQLGVKLAVPGADLVDAVDGEEAEHGQQVAGLGQGRRGSRGGTLW